MKYHFGWWYTNLCCGFSKIDQKINIGIYRNPIPVSLLKYLSIFPVKFRTKTHTVTNNVVVFLPTLSFNTVFTLFMTNC